MDRAYDREGVVHYTVVDAGEGRDFAYSNVGDYKDDNAEKMSCKTFSTMREAQEWYEYQKKFHRIEGSNCLRVRYIHSERRRVLFDYYDYTIDEWLDQIYRSHVMDWSVGFNWWKYIKQDFLLIFQPVILGLQKIHKDDRYHGNLKAGIVLRRNKQGLLFNMSRRLEHGLPIYLEDGKRRDCKRLLKIVRKVYSYPFMLRGEEAPVNDEFERLCTLQLGSWFINDPRWVLNPAIFWNMQMRVKFLRALHRLLYKHRDTHNMQKIAGNCFTNWRVPLNHPLHVNFDLTSYTTRLSKLRLWRNAQEHYELDLNEDNVTCLQIHEEVSQVLDFFDEAVEAMNSMLESLDPRVQSHMPSFFEEMEW